MGFPVSGFQLIADSVQDKLLTQLSPALQAHSGTWGCSGRVLGMGGEMGKQKYFQGWEARVGKGNLGWLKAKDFESCPAPLEAKRVGGDRTKPGKIKFHFVVYIFRLCLALVLLKHH